MTLDGPGPVRPTLEVAGVDVPRFLYGTAWKEEQTARLTRQALDLGFRGIDTANQRRHYVESAVGEAVSLEISSGRLQRSALFLQTKFTFAGGQDDRLPYDPKAPIGVQVEQSLSSSLEHLKTSHVDSYLLHGPSSRHGLGASDWEAWSRLEALHQSGRARLIGISNVDTRQLEALLERATVRPAFVQNRCYARTGWDREVRDLCRAHGVMYQAFSLLTANTRELSHPKVLAAAKRLHKTPAQLTFRFALEAGMIPLTGSSDPEHLRQDLECFDFELSEADAALLSGAARLS